MNLSEQLRQARESQGLSQEALAERLNLSRQSISKWELGASVPTPENLKALCEVLEFSPEPESPPSPQKAPILWKALTALLTLALLSAVLYIMFIRTPPDPSPSITGVYFYDKTGAPLPTEAGWHVLPPGETVIIAVTFDAGTDPDQFLMPPSST